MRHPLIRLSLIAALATASLGGCAAVQEARTETKAIAHTAMAKTESIPASRPVVQVHDQAWLMGEQVKSSRPQPAILNRAVTFNMDVSGWSIKNYASWILNHVGAKVVVDASTAGAFSAPAAIPVRLPSRPSSASPGSVPPLPSALMGGEASSGMGFPGLSEPAPKMFVYTGDLKGFLDRVAAMEGVYWHYRNGSITIFRTETRTWTIPSLPNASSSKGSISTMGGSSSGGSSSSGAGSGAADSASSGTSGGSSGGTSGGSTSMTTSASVDYWGALQKTAQAIAGPGVQIVADKSFGTLSATGTPPELDRLGEWVTEMSSMLRKQVAIEVHVYNVQITREDNYGLNLALQFNKGGLSRGNSPALSITGAGAPSITSTSSPVTFGASIINGSMQGSSVAVQALSTLGNVSQVVSRSGVTLNGQMLALQAARVQNYLASSQTTLTSTVGASTALQPGSVTIGFTGTFLPKVVDGRIMIDLNMTLSDLLGITSATSGGSTIQLPDVQSTTFEQSVALKPGQTLVLTGYRQHTAAVTNNGIGSPDFAALGGGVDAQKGDTILAVVISARIL